MNFFPWVIYGSISVLECTGIIFIRKTLKLTAGSTNIYKLNMTNHWTSRPLNEICDNFRDTSIIKYYQLREILNKKSR